MEESLGLGKKSSGAETDTETWSWFRSYTIVNRLYFDKIFHSASVASDLMRFLLPQAYLVKMTRVYPVSGHTAHNGRNWRILSKIRIDST